MKSDYYLSSVLFIQMAAVTIQLLLPLYGFASEESAASYRVALTVITYAPAAIIIFKRNATSLVIPFLLLFVLYIFHYVFYPDSQTFIESRQAITLTPIALLTGIIVYNIRDFDAFKQTMLFFSRFSPVLAISYVYGRQYLPVDLTSMYSMSFGYSMLLPAAYLFIQRNWYDRLLSIILFLMIFLAGSRGPVFVLAVFFALDILILSEGKKKVTTFISVAIFAIVSVPLAQKYFDFSSSRTLNLVSDNEGLSHSSGRDIIYDKAINAILESPILGHGVGADREILGGYCHNIFLEVTLHYGIIVSFLLFALFIFVIVLLYYHRRLLEIYGGGRFLIIIFMYGFVPKLVSGSYLIDFNTALMIGYLFLCMKQFQKPFKKKPRGQMVAT